VACNILLLFFCFGSKPVGGEIKFHFPSNAAPLSHSLSLWNAHLSLSGTLLFLSLSLARSAGERESENLPERDAPDPGRRRRATAEREASDVTNRRGDLYGREISEREGGAALEDEMKFDLSLQPVF